MDVRERSCFDAGRILIIMPTFTCPAACSNCGTLSGPRVRATLALEKILRAIQEAKELGFEGVIFSGGEATLRWPDLQVGIAKATQLGLPTRLVTNAHWATSLTRAREHLRELIAVGLTEINYSTGDEHVRFIPVENVVHASVAAVELELPVSVLLELRNERSINQGSVLGHPAIASLPPDRRKLLTVVERPWMPLHLDQIEEYPEGLTFNRSNVAYRTGCGEVLRLYTVQANGRIGCCCGIGLRLLPALTVGFADGNDSLRRAIAEAEEDVLKRWIHFKGPEKILAWAAAKDPSIQWENLYAHHCQACQRIYKDPKVVEVIRQNYDEIALEIEHWLQRNKQMSLPEIDDPDGTESTLPPGSAPWNQAATQNVSLVNAAPPSLQGNTFPYSDAFATEEERNSFGLGSSLSMVEPASVGGDTTKFDVLNADPWSHQYLSGPDQSNGNAYEQTGPADDMLEPSDHVSAEGYADEGSEFHGSTDDGSADGDSLSIDGPAVSVNLTQENQGVQLSFNGTVGQILELNIRITNFENPSDCRATNPDKPPEYIWASIADSSGSDLLIQLIESMEEEIRITTDPLPATAQYQVLVLSNRTATLSVRLSEPDLGKTEFKNQGNGRQETKMRGGLSLCP
jgi:hypothetical protein